MYAALCGIAGCGRVRRITESLVRAGAGVSLGQFVIASRIAALAAASVKDVRYAPIAAVELWMTHDRRQPFAVCMESGGCRCVLHDAFRGTGYACADACDSKQEGAVFHD